MGQTKGAAIRFSLRWLFGLVFYAAAGCALLAYGNDLLNGGCHLAFAVLSVVAILGTRNDVSSGAAAHLWRGRSY
jgi:hypothetical protein